jgi:hypothetical protein
MNEDAPRRAHSRTGQVHEQYRAFSCTCDSTTAAEILSEHTQRALAGDDNAMRLVPNLAQHYLDKHYRTAVA